MAKKKLKPPTKTDAIGTVAYLAMTKAWGGPGIDKLIGFRAFLEGLKYLDDE